MAGRLLYSLAVYLSLPYALWRLARRYRGDYAVWREYFGFCPRPRPRDGAPLLWLHAVSLGEAAAAKLLADYMQRQGYRLLLTYTTPAGRDFWRRHYPEALVSALPLDTPAAVRRFFRRSKPALGIIMEAEYWHNLLLAAKANGVTLMLANARLGKANARRYRLIAGLMRRMVACFDIIAAQTARDAGRLRCYGARHIATAGNLKFDCPLPPADNYAWLPSPAVLWAATRGGEEQLLLAAADGDFWRHCFVVLAPRHPQRRGEISALARQYGVSSRLRSEQPAAEADCRLYIADTLGEMHQWYHNCDIAVIGGSFLPYGGQSPIEAMQAGRAIIVGPYMDNYTRLVRQAVVAGAMVQVTDAAAALGQLRQLLADQKRRAAMQAAAQKFYRRCRGALARHIQLMQPLLAMEKRNYF